MTLHKQLTAVFRRTEQPDLDRKGQAYGREEGYSWKRIDFAFVLSPSGGVIDVETPPWRLGGKRRSDTLLVPHMAFLDALGLSGFLWGQSAHTVGVGRPKGDGLISLAPEEFRHFRIFHRAVLAGANNPSIRAFLLFLERWEPGSVEAVNLVQETAGAAVAFRFQYENAFLHECQTARQRWARLLNPMGSAPGAQRPA